MRDVRARRQRAEPRRAASGSQPRGRHLLRKQDDETGLRQSLRRERCRQARPGDHRDDRLERDAGDGRVPDGAAAERDAERADLRVGDLGTRGQPVEEELRVGDVRRPVEPEQPARGAVPARVAHERRVAGRCEERRRQRLHVLVLAAEPVEEHHRRPAARGCGPVRLDERARERRPVRRGDRQLLRRGAQRRARAGQRGTEPRGQWRFADPQPRKGNPFYTCFHGLPPSGPVRLRRRRADRSPRVPRHAPAGGLRLPRRPRAAPVRAAAARRGPPRSRARSAPSSSSRT